MGFQPRCKDVKRRCRSDVLWQIVPDMNSGNWEGSTADGRVEFGGQSVKTRPSALSAEPRNQLVGRRAEFVDEVRRCQPRQPFVHKNGEFEVNPFSNFQPMELTKNRSDVVEFRRRKNQPRSCIHHRLEPLKKMCWDADQGRVAEIQSRQNK